MITKQQILDELKTKNFHKKKMNFADWFELHDWLSSKLDEVADSVPNGLEKHTLDSGVELSFATTTKKDHVEQIKNWKKNFLEKDD